MELILYKNNSDDNVINKNLTEIERIGINFKQSTNIFRPTIRLKIINIPDFNYCEIVELDRKYFVRNIESENNDIWLVNLECDVLETYKDVILNSEVLANGKLENGNYQNINLENQVIKEVEIFKSDVVLDSEQSLILSTVGGV